MLDRYMGELQKCDELLQQRNSVSLIGGALGLPLFLEQYLEKRNTGFHLDTADKDHNTNISVFVRTDDEVEHDSSQRNSREADITVVQLWKSATYVSDARWTQEIEVRKTATKYDSDGGHRTMQVYQNMVVTESPARPLPQCQQRRLALADGFAESVLLALNDPRRLSHTGRLGARKEELRSLRDAPHRPQLGDATRQNQLCDHKSHSHASRQLQLADGHSDSEQPPVDENLRVFDFRTPDLKPNTPKWDDLVQKLSTVTNEAYAREFTEFLRTQCFTKPELLWRNANGDHLNFEMPFALKMEQLLEAAKERRRYALTQLKPGCNLALADATFEIPEKDMKRLWQLRLLRDVF